jgi:transposase
MIRHYTCANCGKEFDADYDGVWFALGLPCCSRTCQVEHLTQATPSASDEDDAEDTEQ